MPSTNARPVATDRLLTMTQLAAKWGWTKSKLRRLVEAKRIPHVRVGARRDVHFQEAVIERWLEEQRVDADVKRVQRAVPRRLRRSVEEECAAFGIEPDEALL